MCVLTCLSDLLIKNDLISNTGAKGIFVEAVEYMNKVVVKDILKQSNLNLDFEIKILKKELNKVS